MGKRLKYCKIKAFRLKETLLFVGKANDEKKGFKCYAEQLLLQTVMWLSQMKIKAFS